MQYTCKITFLSWYPCRVVQGTIAQRTGYAFDTSYCDGSTEKVRSSSNEKKKMRYFEVKKTNTQFNVVSPI